MIVIHIYRVLHAFMKQFKGMLLSEPLNIKHWGRNVRLYLNIGRTSVKPSWKHWVFKSSYSVVYTQKSTLYRFLSTTGHAFHGILACRSSGYIRLVQSKGYRYGSVYIGHSSSILYIENKVVRAITLSSNSKTYTNSKYIIQIVSTLFGFDVI